jgi:hypothetical protein
MATSPTWGENNSWDPFLLGRLAGRRVCLVYDDDEAGRRFRDCSVSLISPFAEKVVAISL